MKRVSGRVVIAVLTVALTEAPGLPARAEPGRWTLAGQGGVGLPIRGLQDQATTARFAGTSVGRRLGEWARVGLELGAFFGSRLEGRGGSDSIFLSPTDFTSDVRTTVFQGVATVQVGPQPGSSEAWLRPYALLGGGVYAQQSSAGQLMIRSGQYAGVLIDIERDKLRGHPGAVAGVGLGIALGARLELGLELRYHRYYAKVDRNLDGKYDRGYTELLNPTARLEFRFP